MRIDEILTESEIVTPQRVTEAIKQVTAELIRDGYASNAYTVNDGMCETLAEDVVAMLGGETDTLFTVDARNFCLNNDDAEGDCYWDATLLKRSWPQSRPPFGLTWRDIKYHVPSHVWIVFQQRHYDAEATEGVANFFELPLIRRGMEAIAKQKAARRKR